MITERDILWFLFGSLVMAALVLIVEFYGSPDPTHPVGLYGIL